VDGVLPGEEVKVEVVREDKKFIVGRAVEIVEKSSARVEPPCEYYAYCGGCQYQHMEYKEELAIKEAQVKEMICHHLKVDESVIGSIQSFGTEGYRYRNGVTLRPAQETKASGRLGYVGRDNASAVVVDDCLIADEGLKEVYQAKVTLPKNAKRVSFNLSSDGTIINSLKESHYRVRLNEKEMWAISDGFFQNNHRVTELVANQLSSWVKEIAPFGFFDLYAGVGTFSLLAAKTATELILIEENASCVDCLNRNMSEHRSDRPWKVRAGRVEKHFMTMSKKVLPEEFMVFLDPPRNGIHDSLAKFLSEHKPFRAIAYLSCDLGNLVRDLKKITSGGGYKIDKVIPFDMFPRTQHIETLVLLKPCSKS